MIDINDIIDNVVDSMKSSGTITSISNVGTTYTIVTSDTGYLEDYFKVKIGDYYYDVTNVDSVFSRHFDVVSTVDISEETSWEMYINYEFGGFLEVLQNQTLKSDNKKTSLKFPLIWLLSENEEDYTPEAELVDKESELTMSIVVPSLKNYTASERIENIFDTKLSPYYELFISRLKKSTEIIINRGEKLAPKKQNRYLYSIDGKNIFSQITDAIEFKVKIKVKKVFENENMN